MVTVVVAGTSGVGGVACKIEGEGSTPRCCSAVGLDERAARNAFLIVSSRVSCMGAGVFGDAATLSVLSAGWPFGLSTTAALGLALGLKATSFFVVGAGVATTRGLTSGCGQALRARASDFGPLGFRAEASAEAFIELIFGFKEV